ncbi:MAG: flagellar hook-associated protein 3 FlgL [Flavobacteriales bacterium]|jgi:flagellar hook-associated protein 3 FlgL
MRISSVQIFNIANNSMADANEAILRTQQQLSTGQRVLQPSDDPVASTKIIALTEELSGIDQYKKNIDIANNDLVIEESILDGVMGVIQRIQELSVQAGNTATLSSSEYTSLANEVDARLEEMQNLLNSQNASGDFIFGGFKSKTEPFLGDPSSGYRYVGDEGQKHIKVSNSTTMASTDSGKTAFVDVESSAPTISTYSGATNRSNPPVEISIGQVVDQEAFDDFFPEDMVITFNQDSAVAPAGKNFTITERSTGRIVSANQVYSPGEEVVVKGTSFRITGNPVSGAPGVPGDRLFVDSTNKQDVLTTMARFSRSMKDFNGTQEGRNQLNEMVATTIENLKHAQTSVLEVTSKIGARFNTLESTEELHADASLVINKLMSELRDVDYAEAATRLSMQTLILEAAQTSFARISRLSLFDRL